MNNQQFAQSFADCLAGFAQSLGEYFGWKLYVTAHIFDDGLCDGVLHDHEFELVESLERHIESIAQIAPAATDKVVFDNLAARAEGAMMGRYEKLCQQARAGGSA